MDHLRSYGILLGILLGTTISSGDHGSAVDDHSTNAVQNSGSSDQEPPSKAYKVQLAELENRLATDPDDEGLRVKAMITAARAELGAEVRHHVVELARRNPYSMRIRLTLPALDPWVDMELLSDVREILAPLVEREDHPFLSEVEANLAVTEFYLAVSTLSVRGGETPRINEVLLRTAIERMEKLTARRPSAALLLQLGRAYLFDDQPRKAGDRYLQAVKLAGDLGSGMALSAAEELHSSGQPEAAGTFARMALDLESRKLHQMSGIIHDAHQFFGLYYLLHEDDLEGAEEHLRRSIEVPERVWPNVESRISRISTALTSALLARGRIQAVQEYLDVMEKRWPQLEETWKEFRGKIEALER